MTLAHTQDTDAAMIENPDLQVPTEAGNEQCKPNTIMPGDTLRMKQQIVFSQCF
jgi:hypothetical protein